MWDVDNMCPAWVPTTHGLSQFLAHAEHAGNRPFITRLAESLGHCPIETIVAQVSRNCRTTSLADESGRVAAADGDVRDKVVGLLLFKNLLDPGNLLFNK